MTEFPALSHYQFQEGRVIESRMYLFDSAAVNTFVRKRETSEVYGQDWSMGRPSIGNPAAQLASSFPMPRIRGG